MDDYGCRQGMRFDVEVDVQDVVYVLDVDNVECDVFEERGISCGVVAEVEYLEDGLGVVGVVEEVVDEVDVVQDVMVVIQLTVNDVPDANNAREDAMHRMMSNVLQGCAP